MAEYRNAHFNSGGKEWCVRIKIIETDFKCLYCEKPVGYANNYCGMCGKKLEWPKVPITEELATLN
jgi:predicted amidophosphoribosyltransferase